MRVFLYVETAKYIECALTSYSDLKRETNNLTDLSKFEEVSFNPSDFYLDPKTTRLIYKDKSYSINKNFVDISNDVQFIILRECE